MSAVKSPRIFRGSTLEELIPQIRAELGADAVITRQRDGLKGGVAGFFQKQFVEVEAVPGDSPKAAPFTRARRQAAAKRTIDVYDEEEEARPEIAPAPRDEAMAEGLQSPAIRAMLEQAAPFAQQLQAAEKVFEPMPVEATPAQPPAPVVAPEPLVVRNTRPAAADAIERGLVEEGITPAIAASVVTEAVSHLAPLSPRTPLRQLVREALARRITVQPSWPRKGRTVGFVGSGGSGKTTCSARLAAAYAQGSDLPVVCISLRPSDGGAALRSLLEPARVPVHVAASAAEARARAAGVREHALVVIDTPSVSPGDQASIARLARDLDEISVYELHLALPATAGAAAAGELAAELEPLGVSRLALTHADETRHFGAAVDLSLRTRIPFSYVGRGTQVPGGLEIADADALAQQVVA